MQCMLFAVKAKYYIFDYFFSGCPLSHPCSMLKTCIFRDRGATLRFGGGAQYTFSYLLFIIFKILGGGTCLPASPPYSAVPDFTGMQ